VHDAPEQDPYQHLAAGAAAGAGALAVATAFATPGAPRWVRITLVLGLLAIACGAGAYAYRLYSRPVTLTVAAGSFDGDASKLMLAVASELTEAEAPVRLKVVEKTTAADAAASFAKGETDLAVIRPDAGDLSSARSLMVVAHAVVLLIAPPGSSVTELDDLKGKTIGVIGGAINQSVTSILATEFEFEKNKTRVRDLSLTEAGDAVQAKQVQALLAVMPITEKYLARLREILLKAPKGKVVVVPIESAGAIASIHKAFESWELPKGILRGSPPVPEEDATTLRMPVYLVASKQVSDDAAGALVKAVFEARGELIAAHPLLAQITEPDTDKDAFIPIHPGAAAYFDGEQKTFFDKYGDQLFYGSMLLGSLASLVAAAWRFMVRSDAALVERPLVRLFALMDEVRSARDEAALARVEAAIDDVLRAQLEDAPPGEINAGEAAAIGVATHRLERAVTQKRDALAADAAMPLAKIRQA
jgi:TRAP transporter TAXI family solute receptor